jgi:hypothetical protein
MLAGSVAEIFSQHNAISPSVSLAKAYRAPIKTVHYGPPQPGMKRNIYNRWNGRQQWIESNAKPRIFKCSQFKLTMPGSRELGSLTNPLKRRRFPVKQEKVRLLAS